MDCNSLISWISLGVTILVALAGGIVFLKYDKRLKRQEKIINDQLKEINQYNLEEIQNKRRPNIIYLRAERLEPIYKDCKGYKLYFENKGAIDAINVSFDFINVGGLISINEIDNILGKSTASIRVDIFNLFDLSGKVKIIWSDDQKREYENVFTF